MKRTDRSAPPRGPVRVLLDTGVRTGQSTGIGNYGKYLFRALRQEKDGAVEAAWTDYDGGPSRTKARLKYLLHLHSAAYRRQLKQFDIVHYTNYAMPFRKVKGVRYVVTVHDLASFVCPETLPRNYGWYNRMMVRHALRRADLVLTVSRSVQREIEQRFPKHRARVQAVYPGTYGEFSDAPVPEQYTAPALQSLTPRSFFLFVGTVEARKNLGIALKAFLHLKDQQKAEGFRFVLAGKPGLGAEKIESLLRESAGGKDVLLTGYLPSEDIRRLYAEAAAYVFPTKYEGFGSPQLECMENHLPLICSDIPTNREISGKIALFFPLEDQRTLEEQMGKVIRGELDLEKYRAAADAIWEKYRWDRLVSEYREAYGSLLR